MVDSHFLYPPADASVGISSWWMSALPMESSSLCATQIEWWTQLSLFAYSRIKDKRGLLLARGFLYTGVYLSQTPILGTDKKSKGGYRS